MSHVLGSRRTLRTVAAVLLAAGALAVAACGSDGGGGGGGGDGPIRIGSLFSVTGPPAVVGDKMRKGLELAVEQINARGGVGGRKLEIVFYDPAGDTAKAVDQTRRLVSRDKVDVVVGGGSQSGIALAMKPVLERAGTLFMATEGAREIVQPPDESKLSFKATFNDTVVLDRTFRFWEARGVKRVGFLPDTSGFGESAKQVITADAPKRGIDVEVQGFDPTATSLTAQLTKLRRANPDAYLAWTTTPAGVTFLKNAAQLGLDDKLIQHGFGFVDERYFEQAGKAGVGAILSSPKLPIYDLLGADDPQKKALTSFASAYQKKYGEAGNVFAGEAYDGVELVARAIEKAGGDTDGKALASALEGLGPYTGVTGVFDFSAQDHSGLKADDVAMIEWDGKRFVPAKDAG